jgi:UDP-N-acetylmuramoyl-L-alanyl-D-glutamate--2,6-diaminopimelate ligase
MTLSRLLEGVSVTKIFQMVYGRLVVTSDIEISGIQYDSRKIRRGELFVAIRGTVVDGHRFIGDAVQNGACAVVVDDDAALDDAFFLHSGVTKIVVPDSRQALARISVNYYSNPSRRLHLIGVTGTNGKTTTTYLLRSILEESGKKVGLIGTIQYGIGDETLSAVHTTPESLELNQLLEKMVSKGCSAAVMEVSSHALSMSRVYGLEFRTAVFTNLTQDHLDFHGSMEEYFRAKKSLFDGLSTEAYAVANIDDGYGSRIVEGTRAHTLMYGVSLGAHVRAYDVQMDIQGMKFSIQHNNTTRTVQSALTGQFNVANISAAYAAGLVLDVPETVIAAGIAHMKSVRGRFEQITSPNGWTAVVDYAHTPDALENCLRTIHGILSSSRKGRVITVFGCGGNRDKGKRPLMGKIASMMSDITIVTSDNPRDEDPQTIINDVMAGVVSGTNVYTETSRRKAISTGLEFAGAGDVVLVAGKGHEDYQVIGNTRAHFDDREEIEKYIRADT